MSPPLSATVSASLIAIALLAIPACTERQAAPDSPTASVTSPATTTPTSTTVATGPAVSANIEPETPEEQVEAAYIEAVTSYYERLQNPDPDDPSIRQQHMGASLTQVLDANRNLASLGLRDRFTSNGAPVPAVREIRLTAKGRAEVTSCLINDVVRYEVSSGRVVDDSANSSLLESSLVLDGAVWKLSDQVLIQKWPDAAGCDR